MAFVETQVVCLPNAWTSIVQFKDERVSLRIQCPVVETTVTETNASFLNNGALHTIAAADTNRKGLNISIGPLDASSSIGTFGPGTGFFYGVDTAITIATIVQATESNWGKSVQSIWKATAAGDGAHAIPCIVFKEAYGCRAIILATKQAAASIASPGGTTPQGLWVSPDMSAGPMNFCLQKELDGDLVTQEWFAWPIGSATVAIDVFESFTIPAIDDPDYEPPAGSLTIGLPKLSRAGLVHLKEMIARYGDGESEK